MPRLKLKGILYKAAPRRIYLRVTDDPKGALAALRADNPGVNIPPNDQFPIGTPNADFRNFMGERVAVTVETRHYAFKSNYKHNQGNMVVGFGFTLIHLERLPYNFTEDHIGAERQGPPRPTLQPVTGVNAPTGHASPEKFD